MQRELQTGEEVTWLDGVLLHPAEVLGNEGDGFYRAVVRYRHLDSKYHETKILHRDDLYAADERDRLIGDLRGIAEDALESAMQLEHENSPAA